MPTELVSGTSAEVSGVDAAANLRKFLITKAKPADEELDPKKKKPYEIAKALVLKWFGAAAPEAAVADIAKMYGDVEEPEPAKDFDEAVAERALRDLKWKLSDALYDCYSPLKESIESIILDEATTDKRGAIATSLQQFLNALTAKGLLTADQVIKAVETFTEGAEYVVKGKVADRLAVMQQIKTLMDGLIAASPAPPPQESPGESPIEKKESTMADATAAAQAPPETVTKAELADIQKRLDTAEALAAAEKIEKAALETRLVAAETIAKAEKDTRLEAEAVTKAAKDMGHVPGTTPAELGPVLKRAKEALPEADFAVLEKALTTASEAIKKGNLFKEIGSNGSNGTDAQGQLQGIAKSLQAADPKLTKEQAFAKAMVENPSLYSQHVSERGVK